MIPGICDSKFLCKFHCFSRPLCARHKLWRLNSDMQAYVVDVHFLAYRRQDFVDLIPAYRVVARVERYSDLWEKRRFRRLEGCLQPGNDLRIHAPPVQVGLAGNPISHPLREAYNELVSSAAWRFCAHPRTILAKCDIFNDM